LLVVLVERALKEVEVILDMVEEQEGVLGNECDNWVHWKRMVKGSEVERN
jgi:hypothetical protein